MRCCWPDWVRPTPAGWPAAEELRRRWPGCAAHTALHRVRLPAGPHRPGAARTTPRHRAGVGRGSGQPRPGRGDRRLPERPFRPGRSRAARRGRAGPARRLHVIGPDRPRPPRPPAGRAARRRGRAGTGRAKLREHGHQAHLAPPRHSEHRVTGGRSVRAEDRGSQNNTPGAESGCSKSRAEP